MSESMVISIVSEALWTILKVAGPMLLFGLVVGVIISVFQAVTSIQEQTLAFVPKIVAIFVAMIFFGPWMLSTLVDFTTNLFTDLIRYIK